MPRYKCKNTAALEIALGGLPATMRVEADVGTGVSAKTVGELRKVTTWSENLGHNNAASFVAPTDWRHWKKDAPLMGSVCPSDAASRIFDCRIKGNQRSKNITTQAAQATTASAR